MKPSVLIIADFPNWAYYEIQQFIKNSLSDKFDVYCDFIIYNSLKKSRNPIKRIKSLLDKAKYQNIKKDQSYDIVLYLAFYFPQSMNVKWKAKKIIKGIYTAGFPPKNSGFEGSLEDFTARFLKDANAVVCGSEMIRDMYKTVHEKVYYANGIIDPDLFKRASEKQVNNSESFVVGWTGNPNREFKGYYSHVIPAVELAQKKYPSIQLKSRFFGPIETLPMFYDNVDVAVIASDADAGPAMFGEAALMEIPSISTAIGWPHEVIKDNKNGFIINKEITEIAERLILLYEDRQLLFAMSKQIRVDYLDVFNKTQMADKWKRMFDDILE